MNPSGGFCYFLHMLFKDDFATAVKRLRGRRTQKEVAARADLSPSTWNQYEKAHRLPKEESWAKIVRGLGCSEEELCDEVVRAYQERTGRVPERRDGRGGLLDELLARFSQELADRLADRLTPGRRTTDRGVAGRGDRL